jgi:hypothetical protein
MSTETGPLESGMKDDQAPLVPCPFVYDDGHHCTGHIVKIKAFKAELHWILEEGSWQFKVGFPRTHYHLRCSENGNHAEPGNPDIPKMKFFPNELPEQLRFVLR